MTIACAETLWLRNWRHLGEKASVAKRKSGTDKQLPDHEGLVGLIGVVLKGEGVVIQITSVWSMSINLKMD